jgi:hypothetical protein
LHCVFTYLSGQPVTRHIAWTLGRIRPKKSVFVDNFFADFFFNEINRFTPESCESMFFIDFSRGRALFQCPTGAQAQISPVSGDRLGQRPAYSALAFDAALMGFNADF